MKNVLVTGATRGLGLSITRRLASEGYRVLASGRTQTPELAELLAQHKDSVFFSPLDLADTGDIPAFVKALTKAHGPLYGLVNNAGVGMDGVLGTMHNNDIERTMKVNAVAPMILTKYACRSMMVKGAGRIINISSIIATTGFSGLAVYAASKASLEGFTRSLARELGRLNITVNAVAPGFMETAMTESLQGEKLESILRRTPLRHLATPDDAAGAVSYLLSDDGRAVTGTVLTVDAGSTA